MGIIAANHRKDLKMLACHKTMFYTVGQEEYSSLLHRGCQWIKKITVKAEIYKLFFQNCVMIFEEAIRALKMDELPAPELSNVLCRL